MRKETCMILGSEGIGCLKDSEMSTGARDKFKEYQHCRRRIVDPSTLLRQVNRTFKYNSIGYLGKINLYVPRPEVIGS